MNFIMFVTSKMPFEGVIIPDLEVSVRNNKITLIWDSVWQLNMYKEGDE